MATVRRLAISRRCKLRLRESDGFPARNFGGQAKRAGHEPSLPPTDDALSLRSQFTNCHNSEPRKSVLDAPLLKRNIAENEPAPETFAGGNMNSRQRNPALWCVVGLAMLVAAGCASKQTQVEK